MSSEGGKKDDLAHDGISVAFRRPEKRDGQRFAGYADLQLSPFNITQEAIRLAKHRTEASCESILALSGR